MNHMVHTAGSMKTKLFSLELSQPQVAEDTILGIDLPPILHIVLLTST